MKDLRQSIVAAAERARRVKLQGVQSTLEQQRVVKAATVPADIRAFIASRANPAAHLTETQRVLALPVVDYFRENGEPLRMARDPASCPVRFWPEQEAAFRAIKDCGGGLIGISVGGGKAYIACLAGVAVEAEVAVVVAPARTLDQIRRTGAELRPHFPMPPTSFISYTMLSNDRPSDDEPELLERLTGGKQRAVICFDEAHAIANLDSARTRKVLRHFEKYPEHLCVALSGTLTSKSLREFSHISQLCLGRLSPIPSKGHHLDAWAEVIDVAGRPGQHHWDVVDPLLGRGSPKHGDARRTAAREAFQRRLRTAPGVVVSAEGALGTSLVISAVSSPVPPRLVELEKDAHEKDARPDGEIFADDLERWRFFRQLSLGFWYRWVWPDDEPDWGWMTARSEWRRQCSGEIARVGAKGYDSPRQIIDRVEAHLEKGRAPRALHRAWLGWLEERHKPEPPTEAVWETRAVVLHALMLLADADEPTILWYQSKAVAEMLRQEGLRVFGAGDEFPMHLLKPGAQGFPVAMSWQAQGTGLNLQHGWARSIVLEPPAGNKGWEQMLGRTHRPHQKADEVLVQVYQHTDAFRSALAGAREQARYVEHTTGAKQKLCYATYDGI